MYEVAVAIYEVAPWERYPETDVFGVQHPATGVTDYVSLMGELGTHKAVALYLGSEGWFGFWNAQRTEPDPETRPEEILEVPHLQLAFGARDELMPAEAALIKRLGLRFGSEAWPSFRSYAPGLYPWPLTGPEQARFLPALLQVLALHDELDGKLGDKPPDALAPCLVRVQDPATELWRDEWRMVAPPCRPTWVTVVPEELVAAYLALPPTTQIFELDLFMTMQACQDSEFDRPYWPYLLAVMDAKSGFAFKAELLSPAPSFHQMWEQVPTAFLRAVLEGGIRPAAVRVRDRRLAALLAPVAKRLELKVRTVKRLPEVERMRTSALRMMDEGRF